MSIAEQVPFQLQRIGLIMEPDPHDPAEAWGVLNPASARARDGQFYLFPREVAEGNYSRIRIAKCQRLPNAGIVPCDCGIYCRAIYLGGACCNSMCLCSQTLKTSRFFFQRCPD